MASLLPTSSFAHYTRDFVTENLPHRLSTKRNANLVVQVKNKFAVDPHLRELFDHIRIR